MDFGGLDDILDEDIGYIPTAIKRQEKPRGRPASISRQNSTQSIGSIKDAKQEQTKINPLNKKQEDSLFGLTKQSPKDRSFNSDQQPPSQSGRRNTLFGLHKETAQQVSSNQQGQISFEDFFKNQNTPNNNVQSLSKPPLPESRNPVVERKLQKNSSFSQLSSPENIIDDEFNNSSVASRRGRPPMSRRTQNAEQVDEIPQNKSDNFATSKGFSANNQVTVVGKNLISNLNVDRRQQTPSIPNPPVSNSINPTPTSVARQVLTDQSIEQLKKIFSNQLEYQKQAFETLVKQERQSHQLEIQKLKDFHQEEMKRKIEIKDFQLEKMKEFYELQLKIYNQRQYEVKQYSSITKKLQGNIEIIEKLQKNIKENQMKDRTQKQDQKNLNFQRKQAQLKKRQAQLHSKQSQLEQQLYQLRNEKIQLNQQINAQKSRIYELELQIRKKQSQLQLKYKKLQAKLTEEYDVRAKQLQRQRQEMRMESLQVKEQRNILEVEKLQVINSRKLWDNEKKTYLEQLHQQKTKVLEKQIELASRNGQIQIKQQEIQMNQNDYLNRLKLVQLEKKKMEIQKKTAKGQLYFNATSMAPLGIKTNGLLGTTLLNRTSQSALNKEFYSNQDCQYQPFEEQTNYKKSITQMRDQFLKSLPKF